jgi:hypothetical protein
MTVVGCGSKNDMVGGLCLCHPWLYAEGPGWLDVWILGIKPRMTVVGCVSKDDMVEVCPRMTVVGCQITTGR